MLDLFETFDIKLAKLVRDGYRQSQGISSASFKRLIAAVQKLRDEMLSKAGRKIKKILRDVGDTEHEREWNLLVAALDLKSDRPEPPTTTEALKEPFSSGSSGASTLAIWLATLQAVDFSRIRDALMLAAAQKESVDTAVARVVGTEDRQFRDGVAAITRNNIRAILATSIVHVASFVREHLWARTEKIVGMVWVSILDSRTTAVCRARDNKVVMFGDNAPPEGASLLVPQGARPPAHPNCRSRMVAFVAGAIPIRKTFDEFLREQTVENQNKILGVAKANLYRQGKVTLDDFVDDLGEELTITQLKAA